MKARWRWDEDGVKETEIYRVCVLSIGHIERVLAMKPPVSPAHTAHRFRPAYI